MTIITVNRNICRTYVSLKELVCGCDYANVNTSDVHIILRRAGPGVLVCEQVFNQVGCGAIIGPRKTWFRVPGQGIQYAAFDKDAQGRIGFLWDSKFLEGIPGRWNGELFVCGKHVATLRFQLGSVFALGDSACVENDVCPTPSACPPACN